MSPEFKPDISTSSGKETAINESISSSTTNLNTSATANNAPTSNKKKRASQWKKNK